jgi:hypothetical protein
MHFCDCGKRWISRLTRCGSAVVGLALAMGAARTALAITASATTSHLDVWTYDNALDHTPPSASTFSGGMTIDPETNDFVPIDQLDPEEPELPARASTTVIAFNTASMSVPTGLAANRYAITSVTFTATNFKRVDDLFVRYEDSHVTREEIRQSFVDGTFTNQQPMELFGVGFNYGYTGFAFSGSDPTKYREIISPNSGPGGQPVMYPIIGSSATPGSYLDVSNNVTGGTSATEPSGVTAPFDAQPWAVGTTSALAVGDNIPSRTTFTFNLDLELPGVRNYIQQSLSDGALGFTLSTLHQGGFMGVGGSGFPRFYQRESAPPSAVNGVPPTLTIQYEVLPEVPGDFNGDQIVDGGDFLAWQRRLGAPTNGLTGAALQTWRDHFGPGIVAASSAVPEPSAGEFAAAAIALLGRARRSRQRDRVASAINKNV